MLHPSWYPFFINKIKNEVKQTKHPLYNGTQGIDEYKFQGSVTSGGGDKGWDRWGSHVDCCGYGLHMATTPCIHTLGSPLPHWLWDY